MVNAEDVADLLVHSTVERFGDEIAIIAAYGSRARDEAADGSDLDIFYIPVADADPPAARAFVVDGLASLSDRLSLEEDLEGARSPLRDVKTDRVPPRGLPGLPDGDLAAR